MLIRTIRKIRIVVQADHCLEIVSFLAAHARNTVSIKQERHDDKE